MVAEIVMKLRRRLIQNFMDIIVLSQLRHGSMSGYDVIRYVHKQFGIMVSSGTVYSLLHSLERDDLIKGVGIQRKTVYTLTEEGEKAIKDVMNANWEIQNSLIKSFMRS